MHFLKEFYLRISGAKSKQSYREVLAKKCLISPKSSTPQIKLNCPYRCTKHQEVQSEYIKHKHKSNIGKHQTEQLELTLSPLKKITQRNAGEGCRTAVTDIRPRHVWFFIRPCSGGQPWSWALRRAQWLSSLSFISNWEVGNQPSLWRDGSLSVRSLQMHGICTHKLVLIETE